MVMMICFQYVIVNWLDLLYHHVNGLWLQYMWQQDGSTMTDKGNEGMEYQMNCALIAYLEFQYSVGQSVMRA